MSRPGSWNGGDGTHPGIVPDNGPKKTGILARAMDLAQRRAKPGSTFGKFEKWFANNALLGTGLIASILAGAGIAFSDLASITEYFTSSLPDISPDNFDLTKLATADDVTRSVSLGDLVTAEGAPPPEVSATVPPAPAGAETAVALTPPAEATPAPASESAPATAEKPADTATPKAVDHKPPDEDTYKSATANLEQIASTNITVTPEHVQDLQDLLSRRGVSISDAQAAEILKSGGYTVDGHSYQIWQSTRGAPVVGLETFYTTETPSTHADYTTLAGEAHTLPIAEQTPEQLLVEVDDATKYELAQSRSVLLDAPIQSFTGENPYQPGTPEYGAWTNIHTFLVTHEPVMGNAWKTSPGSITEYFTRVGVFS